LQVPTGLTAAFWPAGNAQMHLSSANLRCRTHCTGLLVAVLIPCPISIPEYYISSRTFFYSLSSVVWSLHLVCTLFHFLKFRITISIHVQNSAVNGYIVLIKYILIRLAHGMGMSELGLREAQGWCRLLCNSWLMKEWLKVYHSECWLVNQEEVQSKQSAFATLGGICCAVEKWCKRRRHAAVIKSQSPTQ
jgi:hypothetical protein